jgi:hypothetical protein
MRRASVQRRQTSTQPRVCKQVVRVWRISGRGSTGSTANRSNVKGGRCHSCPIAQLLWSTGGERRNYCDIGAGQRGVWRALESRWSSGHRATWSSSLSRNAFPSGTRAQVNLTNASAVLLGCFADECTHKASMNAKACSYQLGPDSLRSILTGRPNPSSGSSTSSTRTRLEPTFPITMLASARSTRWIR